MKMLDVMQRKRELSLGGKVDGNIKGAAQKKIAAATLQRAKKKKSGKKN